VVLKETIIGDYCWFFSSSIVHVGVVFGSRTIVRADAVVTKSFPDGYCVIGANSTKLIKELDKEKFVPTKYSEEYYGFVPKKGFGKFAKKYLKTNMYLSNYSES